MELFKITRYQQYFGIKRILERVEKEENGGVIWHTQGSGKSLTMVMLTKLLQERFVASKVVVVTDRKALDRQITNVFKSSEVDVKRATSARDLISLLRVERLLLQLWFISLRVWQMRR